MTSQEDADVIKGPHTTRRQLRPGVSEDSSFGFSSLSRAYVNRIRTSLLLVTDEELRFVKKFPARIVKALPVVEMRLEP